MQDRIDEITQGVADDKELAVLRDKQTIAFQMSTRNGRRFVWMILSQSGLLQNPLHPEVHYTGFNIGKQDLGRWLFVNIHQHCPEMYPIMVKEAKEDEEHDDGQQHES